MDVAAELLSCERISQVTYGATLQTDFSEHDSRVVIESVSGNGPASKAAFKPGDVVLAVAGRQVQRRLDVERR